MWQQRRSKRDNHHRGVSARRRLIAAAIPGIIVGIVGSIFGHPFLAWLTGWEVLVIWYLVSFWLRIRHATGKETARYATTEDPTIALSEALLIGASIASLAALISVLTSHTAANGWARTSELVSVVVGLALSWLIIHTVFAVRYARLYYAGARGGIDFHQTKPPCYSDFVYMALTIGMTFQVSDTDISSSSIRRTIIIHSLLSYLFGAVILATAINLLVNLSH